MKKKNIYFIGMWSEHSVLLAQQPVILVFFVEFLVEEVHSLWKSLKYILGTNGI